MIRRYKFFIDRGGTFTDCYAQWQQGEDHGSKVIKLLSVDPDNYEDAVREAIRRVLVENRDLKITAFEKFPASSDKYIIEEIRMGTTVATNALLERQGAKTALLITKGFQDLLEIGTQNRPKIFDLAIKKPELIYQEVRELDERFYLDGEIEELNIGQLEQDLEELNSKGIESLAVVLMHSYKFTDHEQQVKQLAQQKGFKHCSISSDLVPMIKIVPRGDTTLLDAYLSPILNQYIDNFKTGFSDGLENTDLLFMKSDGGLTEAEKFSGFSSMLSGPAGGVVALSGIYDESNNPGKSLIANPHSLIPLIGFDMGGTSTDVSRFAGDFEINYQSEISGLKIQAPQLDIKTVAAGGGSRLFYENGMFRVGPESSGSHPGPVCYKKGGYLSITDANLVLGRLIPEYFPKVFGPKADQALDKATSLKAFEELAEIINADQEAKGLELLTIEEIASGFIQVANETMARPIREVSVMKGFDIQEHCLVSFGGAGAQHACAIAQDLGIKKVLIHKHSGILSAYGIRQADLLVEKICHCEEEQGDDEAIQKNFQKLERELRISQNDKIQRFLNLRYQGTDTQFMVEEPDDGDYEKAFEEQYQREFGFVLKDRQICVDDLRLRVTKDSALPHRGIEIGDQGLGISDWGLGKNFSRVYFDRWYEVPVYHFSALSSEEITGPAIIMQDTSTIVLEPNSKASLNSDGNLEIDLNPSSHLPLPSSRKVDPIQLTIYANRFMSIAEQMGRSLEKTSISTNIKERLDFSCAVFDADANLVANAPHQPVHLGSMGYAVKSVIARAETIKAGDAFLTNHPEMGGSHLPDLTVISPVFLSDLSLRGALATKQSRPSFYLANRAHHADIGGIVPGSMPSFSNNLAQEGIAIKSFKLVEEGSFQEKALTQLLEEGGARTIEDNVSDLKAQLAANKKGQELLLEMIESQGLEQVENYMQAIQDSAEESVRKLLKELDANELEACDYLDDGSLIKLNIKLNKEKGSAVFDFTGTATQLDSNLNTPKAVTSSAVLYALRAMIDSEIPLNQGCLKPVDIILPENSLLNPSREAAIVGGNVLTSQRIVDVIFKAFGTCAASQGCMNNVIFGRSSSLQAPEGSEAISHEIKEAFGYYETIGGGAGAGLNWHGASAVHTHMTNTKITDPEILESRYPVRLREFSIRRGSGGQGKFKGGDGLIRVFEFLDDLQLSVLTERRNYQPYGMAGGEPGTCGENWLNDENIGAKNQVQVTKGDRLKVLTPGGGAYG